MGPGRELPSDLQSGSPVTVITRNPQQAVLGSPLSPGSQGGPANSDAGQICLLPIPPLHPGLSAEHKVSGSIVKATSSFFLLDTALQTVALDRLRLLSDASAPHLRC